MALFLYKNMFVCFEHGIGYKYSNVREISTNVLSITSRQLVSLDNSWVFRNRLIPQLHLQKSQNCEHKKYISLFFNQLCIVQYPLYHVTCSNSELYCKVITNTQWSDSLFNPENKIGKISLVNTLNIITRYTSLDPH